LQKKTEKEQNEHLRTLRRFTFEITNLCYKFGGERLNGHCRLRLIARRKKGKGVKGYACALTKKQRNFASTLSPELRKGQEQRTFVKVCVFVINTEHSQDKLVYNCHLSYKIKIQRI